MGYSHVEGNFHIFSILSPFSLKNSPKQQLIEFPEHASPVTCVQFHPYELLLGAGRNDGTVDLYDLESEKIIARATETSFSGHTVKCITFSEKGDNLFVGSTIGVSVIGWEPDRDLGYIEATWNMLGDMKIINNRLMCGAYEASKAAIYVTPVHDVYRLGVNAEGGKLRKKLLIPRKLFSVEIC